MTNRSLDSAAAKHARPNTQSIMLRVLAAMIPGVLLYCFFISPLIIANVLFAIVCALLFEALALTLRKQPVTASLTDGSIVLAAALLAVAVPPGLPFGYLCVGVFIMVMLGKHVYGGLGNNLFNPAMVGYCALLVSFPQAMTLWFNPAELQHIGLLDQLQAKLGTYKLNGVASSNWDAITQATPLEHLRTLTLQSESEDTLLAVQRVTGSGWLWVNSGFLLGGLYLVWARHIRWHIPLSVLITFMLLHLLFSASPLPVQYSVLSGAVVMGAFFIATDPVTAASSNRGRIMFGIGVGALTFVIREYGGYPEGFAFAILLMNLCVPLIDHLDMMTNRLP